MNDINSVFTQVKKNTKVWEVIMQHNKFHLGQQLVTNNHTNTHTHTERKRKRMNFSIPCNVNHWFYPAAVVSTHTRQPKYLWQTVHAHPITKQTFSFVVTQILLITLCGDDTNSEDMLRSGMWKSIHTGCLPGCTHSLL